jgi:hypothetical protein
VEIGGYFRGVKCNFPLFFFIKKKHLQYFCSIFVNFFIYKMGILKILIKFNEKSIT